jgi:lysyl-tRNA synthetase class 1
LKIRLRDSPNDTFFKGLTDVERSQIMRLSVEMEAHWGEENLTSLVYAIPKKPEFSEQEKKAAQRVFFKNVYNMLIDAETGPRLPTFLVALGKEKVKKLLTPSSD